MSRKHHYLKTETQFFQAIERGEKKFEVRFNDRDFNICDMLNLEETVNGVKTGRAIVNLEINYILKGSEAERFGLKEGYCVMSWK